MEHQRGVLCTIATSPTCDFATFATRVLRFSAKVAYFLCNDTTFVVGALAVTDQGYNVNCCSFTKGELTSLTTTTSRTICLLFKYETIKDILPGFLNQTLQISIYENRMTIVILNMGFNIRTFIPNKKIDILSTILFDTFVPLIRNNTSVLVFKVRQDLLYRILFDARALNIITLILETKTLKNTKNVIIKNNNSSFATTLSKDLPCTTLVEKEYSVNVDNLLSILSKPTKKTAQLMLDFYICDDKILILKAVVPSFVFILKDV